MNIAVVAPDATVTDAGTVTDAVALLASETVVPALGAAADSITVQVVAAEGGKTKLAHCNAVTEIGPRIVSTCDLLDAPSDAVNVAFWSEVTTPPLAVNVAAVAPDATVTLAGTIRAAGALLASETLAPPLPAAFEIVTVQLAAPEDARLVLAHCSDVIVVDTVTDNPVETLDAPTVAVTVTLWSEVTAAAVAVNVAVFAPDATVTDAGTVTAAATLLDSETVVPALGADADSVTVQVVAAEGAKTVLAHCTPVTEICARIVST